MTKGEKSRVIKKSTAARLRSMAGRIESERAAPKRTRILREGAQQYKEAMKRLAKR